MKYTDYKWEEVFIAGTLKNLFLEKHQLRNKKMKKNENLALISTCLATAQLDKATCQQPARKVNVEEDVDFHMATRSREWTTTMMTMIVFMQMTLMMTAMVVTTKSMMAATKTRMSFFKKLEVPAKKMMMIKKRIIG